MGVGNQLLDLAAEMFTVSGFERFLTRSRLAQILKVLSYKDLSDFVDLYS